MQTLETLNVLWHTHVARELQCAALIASTNPPPVPAYHRNRKYKLLIYLNAITYRPGALFWACCLPACLHVCADGNRGLWNGFTQTPKNQCGKRRREKEREQVTKPNGLNWMRNQRPQRTITQYVRVTHHHPQCFLFEQYIIFCNTVGISIRAIVLSPRPISLFAMAGKFKYLSTVVLCAPMNPRHRIRIHSVYTDCRGSTWSCYSVGLSNSSHRSCQIIMWPVFNEALLGSMHMPRPRLGFEWNTINITAHRKQISWNSRRNQMKTK